MTIHCVEKCLLENGILLGMFLKLETCFVGQGLHVEAQDVGGRQDRPVNRLKDLSVS